MERVSSPSPTPTSQHAGTTSDNSQAMTAPGGSQDIPVSTQAQPKQGAPAGGGGWKATPAS